MTAIQAVYIRSHEERLHPKPHTVYAINIQAHVSSWQMWRRYSEFDDLHAELIKSIGSAPPEPLPPKHRFALLRSHANEKLLEERRFGLECYLRAIISARDDRWRETLVFKDFLGVPIGEQAEVPCSPSGLDEHLEPRSYIRDKQQLMGPQKPITRVFGARQPLPQETDETRPLDDSGIFQLQKMKKEDQDAQVGQLVTILRRQRQLGEAIGAEIEQQNELLDDVNNDVDRVGGKLAAATTRMKKLG